MSATYVHFGNINTKEYVSGLFKSVDGERITEIIFPEGMTILNQMHVAIASLRAHQGLSDKDKPSAVFVKSNNKALEALLAEELGIPENSVPRNYGAEHNTLNTTYMPVIR